MGEFVKFEKLSLDDSVKIIKKDSYAKYLQAEDIIKNALRQAKEIQQSAFESYRQQKEEGFAAGMNEAKPEIDKKIIDLSALAIENLRDIESAIVDIVNYCIKKIIGEMKQDELISRLVAKKVSELEDSKRVVITVHESINKSDVEQYIKKNVGIDNFTVKQSSDLEIGELLIDTSLGTINTTIEEEVLLVSDEIKVSVL